MANLITVLGDATEKTEGFDFEGIYEIDTHDKREWNDID